ncbi:MFS transporter [Microbacterium sp.]|uniref:MFS transporter n=1 Tax=Microbacterium sp. TaxID=51671 RepID=UPI0039E5AF4F
MTQTPAAHLTTDDPPASAFMKLLVVIMLFLSYMLFAVAWNWGDLYVRSLGFSASRTALMTNAITIAQVVGSFFAANVMLRVGPRRAFTLASALIIFGGIVALTDAFPLVFFIRFVMGLGGALMVVLGSGILARLLTGTALQVANGINSVAFNTGLAVALTFGMQMNDDPAFAVALAAGLSATILILWLVISRSGLRGMAPVKAVDRSYTMRDGFREWFNWVYALAYTGLLSYYIVAFTFMNAGTVRWVVYAGIVGALSGTVVSARVAERRKPLIVVICAALQLIAAALVLAMSGHRLEILIGVILGLVIFFPMPFFVQTAFIRPEITPRQIAVTFSIFWAVSYAGSVVIIQIFAWIADATGGLGPDNVPVSVAPMIFIVAIEATFLIGTFLIWRWFARQWAARPVTSAP